MDQPSVCNHYVIWSFIHITLSQAHTPTMQELGKKFSSCELIKLHAKACSLKGRVCLDFSTTQPSAWHPCGNFTTTTGPGDAGANRAQRTCGRATRKI